MFAKTDALRQLTAHQNRPPSGELPKSPDDIDLDRIVTDPDYRRAVQELLRRWGIRDDSARDNSGCDEAIVDDKGKRRIENRVRSAGIG